MYIYLTIMIEDLSFRRAEDERLNEQCSVRQEVNLEARYERLMDEAARAHKERPKKPAVIHGPSVLLGEAA